MESHTLPPNLAPLAEAGKLCGTGAQHALRLDPWLPGRSTPNCPWKLSVYPPWVVGWGVFQASYREICSIEWGVHLPTSIKCSAWHIYKM